MDLFYSSVSVHKKNSSKKKAVIVKQNVLQRICDRL